MGWRGRVGEHGGLGPDGLLKGLFLDIFPPEMPWVQDSIVKAGVWSVRRSLNCNVPSKERAQARPAQSPRPIAGTHTSRDDPFASLARCEAQRPGPEPSRTVVSLCAPALLAANAGRGLEPVPAARRRQPFFAGRTSATELTGEPVALRVDGGLTALDGVRLTSHSRRAERVELAVTSWPGGDTARSGHLRLTLRPGARLRASAGALELIEPGGRTRRVPLRGEFVTEDE